MANKILLSFAAALHTVTSPQAQVTKQVHQMTYADSANMVELVCDYVWVGTAEPALYAKNVSEGRKSPFYNHNSNYQVDLAAIPLGAEIGTTALLELFKK